MNMETLQKIAEKFASHKCQKCGEPIGLTAVAQVMDSSKMSFQITPHEGELISAETAGGTLTNVSKLLKAVGKDMGVDTAVLLSGMKFDEGKVSFDLLLTRVEKGKIKKRTLSRDPAGQKE